MVLDAGGQRVLLYLREDFHLWSLPGGRIEPEEAWVEAAVRETCEETGYQIVVDRLVGEYRRPQMPGGDTKYVCVGRVIGGSPIERGPETLAVSWFHVNDLPPSVSPPMREYIRDALSNYPAPLHKTQRMPHAYALTMRFLLRLRDARNWLRGRA